MGTKFGVQSKLLISFALVGLMAVVSAVVGAVSFNKFGEALTTITEEKLPPIAAAQQLATESAEIVAIAPRIVAASSTDEELAIKEELDFRLLELVNKIGEIEATGFMPEVIATINDNRVQLQENLGKLHAVTQERFTISTEKAEKLSEFQDLAKRYGDTLKPVLSYTQNDIAQGNAYAKSLKDDPSAQYTADKEEVMANFLKMNDAIASRAPVLEIERLGSSAANMIIASTTETQAVRLSIIPVRIRGTYADAVAALDSIANDRLKNFYVELIDKMTKLSMGEGSLPELRKRELAAAEESQRLVIQSAEFANAMRNGVAEVVAALNDEVDQAAAQAKVVEKQSLTALAVVAAAALLISLLIYIIYVRGNLLRRLAGLQNTMVTLADGNLDVEVPVKGNDEITAMGRAVEIFKENAIKVRVHHRAPAFEIRVLNRANRSGRSSSDRSSLINYSTLEPRTMLAASDVVINEIHFDPDISTEQVEFIELYNSGSTSVDLSGWVIDDAVDFTFPSNTTISANGYAVVTQNASEFQTKFGVTATGQWETGDRLSNEGENIELRSAAGVVIEGAPV